MTSTAEWYHRDGYVHLAPLFAEHRGLPVDDPRRGPLRERLINGYRPVARQIARRYAGGGERAEDLLRVATLGLVVAVDRFEPGRGVDFLAFAVPTITSQVLRHFRAPAAAVRAPRPVRELEERIHPVAAELAQRLRRAPRPSEIAVALDVDLVLVLEALAATDGTAALALDARAGAGSADGGRPRIVLGRLERELDRVAQRESLRPLLAALPERERSILVLRLFGGRTQSEIGAQLGLSPVHVARLLARTLAALRLALAAA